MMLRREDTLALAWPAHRDYPAVVKNPARRATTKAVHLLLASACLVPASLCAVSISSCGGTVVFEEDGGSGEDGDEPAGCPAGLKADGTPDGPCEQDLRCDFYTPLCATGWTCEKGEWSALLDCITPGDGDWCNDDVLVKEGGKCSLIALECPADGITLRCSGDYVWMR